MEFVLNYVTKPSICVIAEFCLFVTLFVIIACQPPLSMGFSRQGYWRGVAISFTPNQDLMPNLIVVSPSLKKVIFTASLEFFGQH